MQQTRRLLEITNPETLKNACIKDHVPNSTSMKDKISKYAFKNNFSVNKELIGLEEAPEETYWVPDRFNKNGWKYQVQNESNPFLNHSNKVNAHGFNFGIQQGQHRRGAGSYTNITMSPQVEKTLIEKVKQSQNASFDIAQDTKGSEF